MGGALHCRPSLLPPVRCQSPTTDRITRPPGAEIPEGEQARFGGDGIRGPGCARPEKRGCPRQPWRPAILPGRVCRGDSAIPQFRAALKLRPSLWKIQALLGIAEKRTGDLK